MSMFNRLGAQQRREWHYSRREGWINRRLPSWHHKSWSGHISLLSRLVFLRLLGRTKHWILSGKAPNSMRFRSNTFYEPIKNAQYDPFDEWMYMRSVDMQLKAEDPPSFFKTCFGRKKPFLKMCTRLINNQRVPRDHELMPKCQRVIRKKTAITIYKRRFKKLMRSWLQWRSLFQFWSGSWPCSQS